MARACPRVVVDTWDISSLGGGGFWGGRLAAEEGFSKGLASRC